MPRFKIAKSAFSKSISIAKFMVLKPAPRVVLGGLEIKTLFK